MNQANASRRIFLLLSVLLSFFAFLTPALFGMLGGVTMKLFYINVGSFVYFPLCNNGACATFGINTIGQLMPLSFVLITFLVAGLRYRSNNIINAKEFTILFSLSIVAIVFFSQFQVVSGKGITKTPLVMSVVWVLLTFGMAVVFSSNAFPNISFRQKLTRYIAQSLIIVSALVLIYFASDLAGLDRYIALGGREAFIGGSGTIDANFYAPLSMLGGYPLCKLCLETAKSIFSISN